MTRLRSKILGVALLMAGVASLMGCGGRSRSIPAESQATRYRFKLTIASVPLENVEDIYAFRVTMANLDRDDFLLNLGENHSDGRCQHPDAMTLILTDPKGRTRQLRFIKSPGHTDPTGGVSPYIVPLRASSAYYLNLNLRQYGSPDGGELEFGPGKYRLRAEFAGTAPPSSDSKSSSFWKGKLRSEELTFRIR